MTTCTAIADPFACPTRDQLFQQLIALLPRGRAWQTHEAVHEFWPSGTGVGEFDVGEDHIGELAVDRLTVMQQFWMAYAAVLAELNTRACELVEQMFCDTVSELLPEWMADYGLPDGCGPWATVCAKIASIGGAGMQTLVDFALDLGWAIEITECAPAFVPGARAGCSTAGCAKSCSCPDFTIHVNVLTESSPAFEAPLANPARAGAARPGASVAAPCPPGAEPLICLIDRFKPAHIKAIYFFDGVLAE